MGEDGEEKRKRSKMWNYLSVPVRENVKHFLELARSLAHSLTHPLTHSVTHSD